MPESTSKSAENQSSISYGVSGAQRLPGYSQNLLKIAMPVAVTLATTKQAVSQVVSIVPGSIIQFNKLCDELLTLEVGNQAVAEGEAVKVGDKFGLRITAITLPEERFGRLEKSDPAPE